MTHYIVVTPAMCFPTQTCKTSIPVMVNISCGSKSEEPNPQPFPSFHPQTSSNSCPYTTTIGSRTLIVTTYTSLVTPALTFTPIPTPP